MATSCLTQSFALQSDALILILTSPSTIILISLSISVASRYICFFFTEAPPTSLETQRADGFPLTSCRNWEPQRGSGHQRRKTAMNELESPWSQPSLRLKAKSYLSTFRTTLSKYHSLPKWETAEPDFPPLAGHTAICQPSQRVIFDLLYTVLVDFFSSAHVFPSTHKISCFRLVIVHVHVGLGYSGAELITRPRLVLNVQSSSLLPPPYSRTGSASSWHHHQQRASKMAPMAHIPPRKLPLSPA